MNYKLRICKGNKLWDYLLVYLLLLLSAGFFFRNLYNRYTVPVYIILLLFTLIRRNINLRYDTLTPTSVMVCLIVITAVLTGLDTIDRYIYCILSLVISYIITQLFTYTKFCMIFADIIYAICIASTVGWIVAEFAPSIITIFPKLVNSAGVEGRFLGLTVIEISEAFGHQNRAQGIFWEPGTFQTMIIIAILCDWFVNNISAKKRYYIYLISILLTFSTTGYICLIVLVVVYCIYKNKKNIAMGIMAFISAVFGVAILVKYRELLPDFLEYSIFTKLEALMSFTPGMQFSDSAASITAGVRVNSVFYPLKAFLESPIWGIGFSGYHQLGEKLGYGEMFTCSPVNYFAYFGIFYAIISISGFLRLIKEYKVSPICKLVIVLLIIICTSTEDYCGGVACISVFILYGYQKKYTTSTKDKM